MFASDADNEILKNASYAAYNEAVKTAFRTLSESITEYFSQHHELSGADALDVPNNFRPLKDYERTLKIQKLTLRLALKTADLSEQKVANSAELIVCTNGHGSLPAQ
jgi:hypothetical protein